MININKVFSFFEKIIIKSDKRFDGNIIKNYRNNSKLLLEEVASGICSLSYLSKIENNIITPKEDILESIKKKLNISDDFENFESLNNISLKTIEQELISNDANKVLLTIEFAKYLNNYRCNFYLLAKALLLNDFETFNAYLSKIMKFDKLTKDECNILYYMTIKSFYIQGYYNYVLELAKLELVNTKINDLHTMIIISAYMSKSNSLNMRNHRIFVENIDTINLQECLFHEFRNKLMFEYDTSKINDITSFSSKDNLYLNLLLSYKKNIIITNHNFNDIKLDDNFNILYLLYLDKYELKDKLIRLIKMIENPININLKMLINYLTIKYLGNNEIERYEKLFNNGEFFVHDILVLGYFIEDLPKQFVKKSCYKSALASKSELLEFYVSLNNTHI